MARDRVAIKKELTDAFISNPIVISMYGLISGLTFEQQFSLVSLENILFDILSFVMFTHEKIVSKNAENSRPHTIRWYREKGMDFLDGLNLTWLNGQFQYDLTNIVDAEDRKIINRCAVLESGNGELVIKIATDNNNVIEPLTAPQLVRFKAYMQQIKDAGNRLRIINNPPDLLKVSLTIYVDPLIIDLATGKLLNTDEDVYPVKDAIKSYLANLEFNGALVKTFFQDALQNATGVRLPIIDDLQTQNSGFPFSIITEMKIPNAGYFKINDEDLTIIYTGDELG